MQNSTKSANADFVLFFTVTLGVLTEDQSTQTVPSSFKVMVIPSLIWATASSSVTCFFIEMYVFVVCFLLLGKYNEKK